MRIRSLEPGDHREGLSTGDLALDRFFREFALQNQVRHHIGVTYVACGDAGSIRGFVTVASGALEVDSLPRRIVHGLPRYPLPVLRIARLGVAERFRSRGIGTALVRHAMGLALHQAETSGCVGLCVDAVPQARGFYERLGFIPIDAEEGQSGARPPTQLLFLPLRLAIRALP